MALLDNFKRGESLSIAFTLPESYDTARIQKLEVVVGSKVYTHTLVDHLITVKLTSADTAKLSGYQTITVMIDDSQLGVQKIDCGTVNALSTYSRYTSDSVNSGNNILITLTVSETIITSSSVYYDIFRVKSVYELAVEEGYTGTEEEYMALLNSVWDVRPYVDFDVDTESTPDVARLMWDAANNTLQFGVPDGGFIQIGQEPHDYYTNLNGSAIANGDIVSVFGASGNRTAVKLTDATDDALALAAFGMVTVDEIGNNNSGRITKSGGKVRGLDTEAYSEGTVLYVDTLNPGKWTDTKPDAPVRAVQIGTVAVSHATNGVIELFIKTYPKLSELADVDGTSETIAEDDQMLIRTVDDGLVKEITKTDFYNSFQPAQYRDEYPSGNWVQASGAAMPDSVAYTIGGIGVIALSFDGVNTEERMTNNFEIPHDIDIDAVNAGTLKMEIHVHSMASTNDAGTCKWFIDMAYLKPDAAPIALTTKEIDVPVSANQQYYHKIVGAEITEIPAGGYGIGGIILFTVRRTPTATGDDYTHDMIFKQCALHVPVNSIGSRQRYIK